MSAKCQGWVKPGTFNYDPYIDSLSSYQSPAGSNTVVSINGSNFCYMVSTISFGTFYPTVYFVNSNIIQFYVPNTLSSGTFPVQVFNGSIGSNIVNYTIDNASGYWLLNSNNNISNTNSSGVVATWFSRGTPVTLNNLYTISNPYVVPNNVNWIICDSATDVYVTLPTGTQYSGREIMFKNFNSTGSILETSVSLIRPLNGGANTNIILAAGTSKWTTLVFNGSIWITMQGN